jgi:hypothetical protein
VLSNVFLAIVFPAGMASSASLSTLVLRALASSGQRGGSLHTKAKKSLRSDCRRDLMGLSPPTFSSNNGMTVLSLFSIGFFAGSNAFRKPSTTSRRITILAGSPWGLRGSPGRVPEAEGGVVGAACWNAARSESFSASRRARTTSRTRCSWAAASSPSRSSIRRSARSFRFACSSSSTIDLLVT